MLIYSYRFEFGLNYCYVMEGEIIIIIYINENHILGSWFDNAQECFEMEILFYYIILIWNISVWSWS